MNEKVTKVDNIKLEKGYEVYYHELRGYDSPDRWYTCRFNDVEIGQVASVVEAINFCSAHKFAALMAEGDFGHTLGIKYGSYDE